MFNKASVNVSCLRIPDLQLPRHVIEPEVCPPPSALPQQVGQIKSVMSAASPDNQNCKPLIKKAASGAFSDNENCKLLIGLAASEF